MVHGIHWCMLLMVGLCRPFSKDTVRLTSSEGGDRSYLHCSHVLIKSKVGELEFSIDSRDLHKILLNWNGTNSLGYNVRGTFFMYSGVSAITILFLVKHVPETKGKTLEEIQASINTVAENIAK
ncbi:hypothetical protein IFM89_022850 [Coptis chinensis]|uniref:Uncharacterized protein n=1 Tax=Coptis chinensis TaxID=261450 RepID=A0A835J1K4_9MAGN|nr:hypothetical protein IFM89_022850 [Coptis chinensis]